MIWIIILLIVILFIIIRFTNDVKKQNNRIFTEGGMKGKYATLIDYLKAGQGDILSERASSITIGKNNMDGSTRFTITQTFKTVIVQWKVQSIVFGNHTLEWEFEQTLSQYIMWDIIKLELQEYQQNKLFK